MRSQAKALFICVVLFTFFASAASALADAPPTVTIDAPTEVSYQSAHVSGTVNPEGGPSTTYWQFQYSTEPDNPFSWAWSSVFGEFSGAEATGTNPIPVEGTLTGLTPGTEYAVRLVADNGQYVNHVESALPNPTFTTLAVAPPTVTIAPPSAVTARTARFEADINPGGNDPAFDTSWFFSCTPACPGVEGTIPGDGVSHHISVDASGLQAGTFYEVTLYATNAGGTESAGPETFTTETEHPTIKKVLAHPLTTEAELVAEIDPGGLETSYHVEYGPTAAYGHSTAVKTLPAGGAVAKATVNIYGLTPGSTYHYRLIVENADGSDVSGDHEFTEHSGAGAVLPNGRAYELVSNEYSNLGEVLLMEAADEGNALAYVTNAGLKSSRSSIFANISKASRGPLGWSTESLEPISPYVSSQIIKLMQPEAFSSDMKKGLVFTVSGLNSDDQNQLADLYLVDASTGATTWITVPPNLPSKDSSAFWFAGASRDLSRIYFEQNSSSQIFPGAPQFSMYEWDEGTVKLVSRLPEGEPAGASRVVNPHQFTSYHSFLDGIAAPHGGAHQVSDDGSTFFQYLSSSGGTGIYARKDEETIGVSLSQKAGSEGDPCYANFIGASHSGDLAYFVCPEELTDSATEGGGIYSYRLSTDELKLLTPDAGSPSGLGISSAIMSDDASHVYFVATAALTPGAAAGEPNLYVYSGGETRFIATVPPGTGLARSSRSGRYAVLESTGSISGANNAGHLALYRYDDQEGEILCVSCRVDGDASTGDAALDARFGSIARNIDDHGNVYFASADRIVPEDLTAAWDVYEYTEGAPHLLSSGRSQYDSFMGDNSDDGTDVFLMTSAPLVRSDQDAGLSDLYDARVGGGLPEGETATAECVEDGCQGSISPSPEGKAPATRDVRSKGRHRRRYRLISVKPRASGMIVIRVSGPGRLSIRGGGLLSQTRIVKAAGTVRARLRLKPSAEKMLRQKGEMALRVSVRFQPSRGAPSSARTTVRFRR